MRGWIQTLVRVTYQGESGRRRSRDFSLPKDHEAAKHRREEAARFARQVGGKATTLYRPRYQTPNHRERSGRPVARKLDAERFLGSQESRKMSGDWIDPQRGRTTFAEFAAEVEASRADRRESTRARDETVMRRHVLPAFGDLPLAGIEPSDVSRWVADMVATGLSPAYVRKAYQLLGGVLTRAVASRYIAASPCVGIDLPRLEHFEMRFLDADEVQELAESIARRYRALVLTAAYTGLRWGELAGLRVDRLDLLHRRLLVEEALSEVRGRVSFGPVKTKGSRRTVTLDPFLAEVLEDHLGQYPPGESALVFTAPEGGPLRRNLFRRRAWLPAVRRSVGEPCRFHDLRHTHAALLIDRGVHPKVIQGRLGHESIRTTLDTYGHRFPGLDEAAAAALESVSRGAVERAIERKTAEIRRGFGVATDRER
jgi:integrase